jgi:hypothetical protein
VAVEALTAVEVRTVAVAAAIAEAEAMTAAAVVVIAVTIRVVEIAATVAAGVAIVDPAEIPRHLRVV